MAGVTLDSGALIAIERGDRSVMAFLRVAHRASRTLVVPAPVVAQVWRGPRSARIGQFLSLAFVEPMTESIARRAGELLARSGTADVADATVAVIAAARGDDILTGDIDDLRGLARLTPGAGRIVDLAALPRL